MPFGSSVHGVAVLRPLVGLTVSPIDGMRSLLSLPIEKQRRTLIREHATAEVFVRSSASFMIAIVLACPLLCQLDTDCCSHSEMTVTTLRCSCCPHRQGDDQGSLPARPASDDCDCSCVCNGATLTQSVSLDLGTHAVVWATVVDESSLQAIMFGRRETGDVLRSPHSVSGASLRLRECSLRC